MGGPLEGWWVASKGLGPLPRIRRGDLGRGCGREGRGALPLPRAAVISTGWSVQRAAAPARARAHARRVVRRDDRREGHRDGARLGGLGVVTLHRVRRRVERASSAARCEREQSEERQ